MHRISSKSRSLKIQRETVRTLALTSLQSVCGGASNADIPCIPQTNLCPDVDPTGGLNSNVAGGGGCPQLPPHTRLDPRIDTGIIYPRFP